MKAFTGFAIGILAVLGAVAAVFIYLKKKILMMTFSMMTMRLLTPLILLLKQTKTKTKKQKHRNNKLRPTLLSVFMFTA